MCMGFIYYLKDCNGPGTNREERNGNVSKMIPA